MNATMTAEEWVAAIDRHYLAEFIPNGGSSIKFIACSTEVDHREAAGRLRSCAEQRHLIVADIDSSVVRIHMIEQIFGRICDQMPWRNLVESVLRQFAISNHWLVPNEFADSGIVQQLEDLNRLGLQQISLELQRRISTDILVNRKLARDFRLAMHWMARTRLDAGAENDAVMQALTDWLGGRTRLVSDLRRFQIFTKVNRSNARDLLGSLLVWIREAGFAGLVVNVDGYRLLSAERGNDGVINYSSAAILDAYQVFREFIDTTDELDGLLFNVFVPIEFINTDSKSRGLGKYSALFDRVYDGVRDRLLPNPLTALARIGHRMEVES